MEDNVKKLESKVTPEEVVNTILEKGVDFTVTVNKLNLLHRIGLLPSKRKFIIYPIVMGSLLKIANLLSDMDVSYFEDKEKMINLQEVGIDSIAKNKDKMVWVAAYGIVNSEKDPPKSLIRFLDRNLTSKEMLKLVILIVRQMDVSSFLTSTVSATGMIASLTKTPETEKK